MTKTSQFSYYWITSKQIIYEYLSWHNHTIFSVFYFYYSTKICWEILGKICINFKSLTRLSIVHTCVWCSHYSMENILFPEDNAIRIETIVKKFKVFCGIIDARKSANNFLWFITQQEQNIIILLNILLGWIFLCNIKLAFYENFFIVCILKDWLLFTFSVLLGGFSNKPFYNEVYLFFTAHHYD